MPSRLFLKIYNTSWAEIVIDKMNLWIVFWRDLLSSIDSDYCIYI